jgi:hypothetical protein
MHHLNNERCTRILLLRFVRLHISNRNVNFNDLTSGVKKASRVKKDELHCRLSLTHRGGLVFLSSERDEVAHKRHQATIVPLHFMSYLRPFE